MKRIILLSLFFIATNTIYGQQAVVEPAVELLQQFSNVRDFTVSASGNEAYVSLQSIQGDVSVIARLTRKTDGSWNEPDLVSFSGASKDLEPFLSPDNLQLWFASNRPSDSGSDKPKDFDIWYVERNDPEDEWSAPINAGPVINTSFNEFYPSLASNGNIYYTCDRKETKGLDDIFMARWNNDHFEQPVSLSDSINTSGYEFNSYVAPDESFIIYSGFNRPDGFGGGDLYISYRNPDGSWAKSSNLGEGINSPSIDYCPFMDLTSGFLYFTSKRSSLGGKKVKSAGDFRQLVNQYENGMSRIYKVPFSLKDN